MLDTAQSFGPMPFGPMALRGHPGHTSQAAGGASMLDQADGLRRLFAGGAQLQVLPLVANAHVAFAGLVLDRLAAVLAAQGRQVLVVDAGADAPEAPELARLNLAVCIERIAPRVAYLPARGLAMSFVDTRGSAAMFIDAVVAAAPWVDTVLLHAQSHELARVLARVQAGGQLRSQARPILLGADHPDSIKNAYGSAKLLAQRCELLGFDLLLVAAPQSPRTGAIAQSLGQCLDNFLGAWLQHSAVVDPAADVAAPVDAALRALLGGQMRLHEPMAVYAGLSSAC